MEKKFRLLLLLALLLTAATGAWAQSTVNGLFTVNADGDQVQFASGNLRYTSGAWSFFDHQYDYYAEYSADSWDKFGWSTSGTTYGMSTSTNESLYKGDFVDWGNAVGTGWRTLSNDEWAYVFNTRSGSTIGTTANARFAKAVVCDVKGLIIFPDNYAHPNGVTAPTGINETGATGMDGNSYDATAWALMESAGCVFLPAAGGRYHNSNPTLVINAGTEGCYWSSTSDNSTATLLSFKRNTISPSITDSPRMGYSVRLVKSVTIYAVSLKAETADGANWTISPAKAAEGQTVTLQYTGRLKVKGVKATSDEKPAGPAPITLAAKLAYTGGEIADFTDATGDLTTLAWAVGEHIAILYEVEGTKKVADAEITAVDGETGAATIEFTVEDGTPDDTPCTLVYPLSAAKDDHTGVKDAATLLAAQDGTLSANLDVRVGEGTIQTTTPGLTVTTQPAAQFAIFKFTTQDESSTAIDVNSLTVFIGTQKYVITPGSATSELYAALPAVSSQAVIFSAVSSDSKNYVFAKDGVTFAASKYYQSPLTMTQGVHLATISGTSYTVTGNVTLMGTPNNNLTIGYSADNWEVTLDNVNPDGTKEVKISSNRHVNLKLKGTSRLTQIYANNSKNVTIDKAADDGTLILQMSGTNSPLDVFGTVYIKGGTVKARNTGNRYAVYSNLNITGGAVYLAGGNTKAVQGTVTTAAGITLYGWSGTAWRNSSNDVYETTDNTGSPSSWTW